MWGLTWGEILTVISAIGILFILLRVVESGWNTWFQGILWLKQKCSLMPHTPEMTTTRGSKPLNIEAQTDYHRTLALQQALSVEESLRHLTGNLLQCLDETEVLHAALQELAVVLDVTCGNTVLYRYGCSIAPDQLANAVQAPLSKSKRPKNGNTSISLELVSEYMSGTLDLNGLVISQEQCFAYLCQRMAGVSYQSCIPIAALDQRWHTVFFCPIVDDHGSLLGDIIMVRTCDAVFTDDEIHFVQQVADQCAIAIRQSHLYQAAQNQVEELERLNQLKDDFLSTISHELRTPMSNIQMGIDALDRHLKQLHQSLASSPLNSNTEASLAQWHVIHQCIQILQTESQRESELIEDLLNLSRLEAGTEPFLPTKMLLRSWLSHIAEVFAVQVKQQNQDLILNVSQSLEPLTTDFALLERIITELLQNACKYTPAGGVITISAYMESAEGDEALAVVHEEASYSYNYPLERGNFESPVATKAKADSSQHSEGSDGDDGKPIMQIQISNTGVEIPKEECDRIFDKFYRIPSNDPWKHGGTGLGLALVKRLVKHLRGTIHAVSANQQVHMILRLPLSPT